MRNNKNGITLIALVITIIVLLILAGISISLVTGQNGVLTRAEDASNTYSVASAKEQADMRAAGYVSEYMEKVYVDNDLTVGAMTAGEYVLSQTDGEEDGDYRYSVSGSTIIVTSKTTGETLASGTVRDDGGIAWSDIVASGGNTNTGNNNVETIPSEVTASVISSSRNKSNYYGKTVNYSANEVTDWKIFYSDESNIYLIASDYVENAKLPVTEIEGCTNGTHGFTWNRAPSSAHLPILSGKSWNTWTNYSSYKSGRCVSTLLKTDNWDSFKNTYAEYAIGGSTLEMWVESVNAKYPSERQLATRLGSQGFYVYANGEGNYSSNTGTEIDLTDKVNSIDSTKSGINHAVYGDGSEVDSLYFPHTEMFSDCVAYWLASPISSGGESGLVSVSYLGSLNNVLFNNMKIGIRPVVCLNSGVTLTEGTGDYDFNLNF